MGVLLRNSGWRAAVPRQPIDRALSGSRTAAETAKDCLKIGVSGACFEELEQVGFEG
jgi:hypothetical protein